MLSAKSFTEILEHRGRVLLFTPTQAIASPLEQTADTRGFKIVFTRGFEHADPMHLLRAWRLINGNEDRGVFSANQHRFVHGMHLSCTDICWVGETGDPNSNPGLWTRFSQAMSRHDNPLNPPRLWVLSPNARD